MKRLSLDLIRLAVPGVISAILIGSFLLANPAQGHPSAKSSSPTIAVRAQVPEIIVKNIKAGYFQKALKELQPNMAAHADNKDYEYRYAQALLGVGKNQEALRTIKKAISLAPKNGSYYRFMGQVYGALAQNANIFHAMGLAKNVLSAFRNAVRLDPHDPRSLKDLATYYIDAPGIVGGSLSKADKIVRTLKKIAPLDALKVQAHEAVEAHHYDKAETLLRHAVKLDKTSHSAETLAFLYMRRRRYTDGFKTFVSITKERPKNIRAWYWTGRTSILSHSHYAEGIHALQHYIAVPERPDTAPSLAFAHLRLGDLYRLTGKSRLACLQYAKAKNSNNSHSKKFRFDFGKSLRKLRDSDPRNIKTITSRKNFSKATCD